MFAVQIDTNLKNSLHLLGKSFHYNNLKLILVHVIMQQAINKSEFISNLSANCDNMTDTVVDDAVREILNLMTDTLANDGRVEVRGFGSFCLHHRRARMGRNPKTGESVPVPAKAIPHFKPGKALREAVNAKVANG